MSIDIKKLLNSSCVVSEYCNRYIVCWQERPLTPWDWKHKTFALKRDAKQFAKRMSKISPRKPYISKDIIYRSYFRPGIEVEYVKEQEGERK